MDPYTGKMIEEADFLKHPRMIRCFSLIIKVLSEAIESEKNTRSYRTRKTFSITRKEAETIRFPAGEIGVKGIITAINASVDANESGFLTIVALYKVLKEKGILGISDEGGRTTTVCTDISIVYGIITKSCIFQGETYERILYTDKAKETLRKKLPEWFSPE